MMRAAVQTRGMATLKELRGRISSVEGIEKITSSMKMVAAARLGKQERETRAARPFLESLVAPFNGMKMAPPGEEEMKEEDKKQLIMLITSDKGLCGSLNSNLTRPLQADLKNEAYAARTTIGSVGVKGKNGLSGSNPKQMSFHVGEFGKEPLTFMEMSYVTEAVFNNPEKPANYDEVSIRYNHYVNSVASDIKNVKYPSKETFLKMEPNFIEYEFEGDAGPVLSDLYDFLMAGTLYGGMMENMCSELGFRMSSMDGATNNCGEVLGALNVAYNRQRQAAITTELTEIISGAESLSD